MFKFFHSMRVRYSEIDGQKLVFHAHYLTYFDCAMVEYFRQGLNLEIHKLAEQNVFEFVLVKTALEFTRPAKLDEHLAVWCHVERIGGSSLDMNFKITSHDKDDILVTGKTTYVSYDANAAKARPIPSFIRSAILDFEGNERL